MLLAATVALAALTASCGGGSDRTSVAAGSSGPSPTAAADAKTVEAGLGLKIVFEEDQPAGTGEGPAVPEAATVTEQDRAVATAMASSLPGRKLEVTSLSAQEIGDLRFASAELTGGGLRIKPSWSQRTTDYVLPPGAKDQVASGEAQLTTRSGIQVAFTAERIDDGSVRRLRFVTVNPNGQVIEAVVISDTATTKAGTVPEFTIDDAIDLAASSPR